MIGELAREVQATIAIVSLAVIAIALLTRLNRVRSRAVLRLDHFLPFLRKKKKNEPARVPGIVVRWAASWLPNAWLSDPITGKPGLVRRFLKKLGPSVVSAPVRRLVQGVCFLLFLWSFFYVCWPYEAQPIPATQVSPGWKLDRFVGQAGNLQLTGKSGLSWPVQVGQTLFVVDERAPDAIRGRVGEFNVAGVEGERIELSPVRPLSSEAVDGFLTSQGTWSLYGRSPWPSHYADQLAAKEFLPAETFLILDPLVSLSTAIAAKSWVWSLACAAMILVVCVLIPRGFCGYLCPLGSLIDLFDWSVGRRISRFRVRDDGWWVHIKYYLLLGTLISGLFGVLVSGYVAAIPVITRGLLFLGEPLQVGFLQGWHQVPMPNAGHFVSVFLFFLVLALGLLKPRFWCKYVCPSGAVFSLGNLFRISERKVENTCINCNKCVEICPFDAIKPDFTTRVTDCTLCQTCAGVCPTHAIKFVERWNLVELKTFNDPPTGETALGRRGFLSVAAGTAAALVGGAAAAVVTKVYASPAGAANSFVPVRPPGSVPEREFLEMCIRCGECFKACPYNVLQAMGFQQGLEGLWTPHVVADHSGCAPSCNACGQVCPTGAIRALPLEEKSVVRMGLAVVNQKTCLPFANRAACQLCVDECTAAGYHALEFTRAHTQADAHGQPVEGTGYLAPVVLAEKCVGCGLCQMSCHRVNVRQQKLLTESAIIIEAGVGKEDRMMSGSYLELRQDEARRNQIQRSLETSTGNRAAAASSDPDPFGTTSPDNSATIVPPNEASPF